MKKTLAIILAAAMCLCLLPTLAFAAEEAETFTVHAIVPTEWEAPTLGAWGPDGDLMGDWYGKPMTKGEDGWYTIQVPVAAIGMIITNNGGASTQDIKNFEAKEMWIIACKYDDGVPAVSYEKPDVEPPVAPPPVEVETFTVHAQVPEDWGTPTLGAWGPNGDLMGAWYGKPMTKGEDGWYSIEVPVTATGMMVCGEDHDTQYTADLEGFQAKEMWIKAVQKNSGEDTTISYEKPTVTPPEEEPPKEDEKPEEKTTFTVHAKVPADWKDVTLGAWNDSGDLMGAWYGKPMTKGADGWYTIEVPLTATGMIITADNGEGETTQDIVGFEAKEMWITACKYDDGKPTVSYAAPKTGDSTYLAAACGILVISLCGLVAVVSLRKKIF